MVSKFERLCHRKQGGRTNNQNVLRPVTVHEYQIKNNRNLHQLIFIIIEQINEEQNVGRPGLDHVRDQNIWCLETYPKPL